jgi:hypothetical protein
MYTAAESTGQASVDSTEYLRDPMHAVRAAGDSKYLKGLKFFTRVALAVTPMFVLPNVTRSFATASAAEFPLFTMAILRGTQLAIVVARSICEVDLDWHLLLVESQQNHARLEEHGVGNLQPSLPQLQPAPDAPFDPTGQV